MSMVNCTHPRSWAGPFLDGEEEEEKKNHMVDSHPHGG
jgi:hypothetical protein